MNIRARTSAAALAIAFATLAGHAGAGECAPGDDCDTQQSSNVTVSSVHTGDVCYDDYNCYPLATTTCYSDGSCLYVEDPPGDVQGAVVVTHADGSTDIVQASQCDEECNYLMASDPGNHERDYNPEDNWPAPEPLACDQDPELCAAAGGG